MEQVKRELFLDRFEKYYAEYPDAVVLVSATNGLGSNFLLEMRNFTTSTSGLIFRSGFKSFIAISSIAPVHLKINLENCCFGIWSHVATFVNSHDNVVEAIRESEWRSLKGLSRCKSSSFTTIP